MSDLREIDLHEKTATALVGAGWEVETSPRIGTSRPDLLASAPSGHTLIVEIRLARHSVHFAAIAQVANYVRAAAETRGVEGATGALLTTAPASAEAEHAARSLEVLVVSQDPRAATLFGRPPQVEDAWAVVTDWSLRLAEVVGASFTASSVLDAFVVAEATTAPARAESLLRERWTFAEHESGQRLAVRALTQAAHALRLAVGQEKPPREIRTGDDAFRELVIVNGLHLDSSRERAQLELARALSVATDRLGPLPGGRLGSFRAPGQPPAVIEPTEPTTADLEEIAWHAGAAIGYLAATGHADAVDQLRSLMRRSGRDPRS